MYLNTVANVDRAIGLVIDTARATLGDTAGVVVLADHGESLFDEGFLGHGYALNEAQTQIPLVVSNLPMVIQQPFAQADLRGQLRLALSKNSTEPPRVVSDPERVVFQYLGTVDGPAQIAFLGSNKRILYDFRTRRLQVGNSEWKQADQLDDDTGTQFRSLIYYWERLILARSLSHH